ncbi:hypothetical protein SLEP1_g34599 [Rubroshorea leprosula]|uniref:Uncharacterized protein n=1 Tax=Rubroshorea leprosula TaxID=152421 RepID=A0AAV5KKT5_9ROSI|nr:hypothetical protein SLEP1_g34599 [Rubroshorea leprosula]
MTAGDGRIGSHIKLVVKIRLDQNTLPNNCTWDHPKKRSALEPLTRLTNDSSLIQRACENRELLYSLTASTARPICSISNFQAKGNLGLGLEFGRSFGPEFDKANLEWS